MMHEESVRGSNTIVSSPQPDVVIHDDMRQYQLHLSRREEASRTGVSPVAKCERAEARDAHQVELPLVGFGGSALF